MNEDRIEFSQEVIQEDLDPQPQYVVTTSEYEEVKERLSSLQNRYRGGEPEDNRPTLRRRSSGRVDPDGNPIPDDEDERPTLKRR